MSYQYPPPPPLGAERDMSHPAYAPTYHTPQPPSSIGSFPTPGARPTQSSSSELYHQHSLLGSAADKKRSRLGYHRTTVACGNCRRRKIRCAPEPSDDQNRCTNCIRLKKDCSYYPVDQPPPAESQGKQTPMPSKGPSASSSPAASSGNLAELPKSQPFCPVPKQSSKIPFSTVKSSSAEVFPPDAKVPLGSSTNRSLDVEDRPGGNWDPADASQSPGSKPADLNQTWRGYPPESPMSAQYSPFGPGPPSATWTSADSEPGSRGDMPWGNYPPPVRSMSYGGESLASHHSIHFPPGHQSQQFDRRASTLSDVYTPSMGAPPPQVFGAWNEPQQPQQHPDYSCLEAWGYGENEPGQLMHAEPGQLGDSEPPPGTYYGAS
ncbi:hypothetical protein AUP68_12624 [Ilyonectria robusta]